MLPIDEAGYWRVLRDEAVFAALRARIAAAAGVRGALTRAAGGTNLVWFGAGVVLKAFAPWWAAEAAGEVAALARVSGRLPVPVPDLLAHGEVDGWVWLLTRRLGGVPASDGWDALAPAGRRRAAAEAGAAVRALRDVPADGLPAWLGWTDMAGLRATAARRNPGFLDALDGPLPAGPAVFLHNDLHREQVLLDPDGRVTGIVDFGDAVRGPAEQELACPLLEWLGDDLTVRRLFVAEAGFVRDPGLEDRVWTAAVLHPWLTLPEGDAASLRSRYVRLT